MDNRRRKQARTGVRRRYHHQKNTWCFEEEEVSSMEWEMVKMSEQEEDLVYRMHKLVGDRWGLIAGRIPGRNADEIERFWVMRHTEGIVAKTRSRTDF